MFCANLFHEKIENKSVRFIFLWSAEYFLPTNRLLRVYMLVSSFKISLPILSLTTIKRVAGMMEIIA